MSVNVPSSYDFDLDLAGGLTTNSVLTLSIDRLPKIQLGIDPVEIKPLDLSLRIREFPSLRVHLPTDFKVGFNLLGFELATIRLCGKAQAITEPYIPNPCERCGYDQPSSVPHLTLGDG